MIVMFRCYQAITLTDNCKSLKHVSLLRTANLGNEDFKGLAANKNPQKLKIDGKSNKYAIDIACSF